MVDFLQQQTHFMTHRLSKLFFLVDLTISIRPKKKKITYNLGLQRLLWFPLDNEILYIDGDVEK